jgi:hypothetical protein
MCSSQFMVHIRWGSCFSFDSARFRERSGDFLLRRLVSCSDYLLFGMADGSCCKPQAWMDETALCGAPSPEAMELSQFSACKAGAMAQSGEPQMRVHSGNTSRARAANIVVARRCELAVEGISSPLTLRCGTAGVNSCGTRRPRSNCQHHG